MDKMWLFTGTNGTTHKQGNNLQIYRTTVSLRTFQRAEYMINIFKTLFERHRLSCVLLVISLKTCFFGDN
jgi:phenylalanine-4-hydroxylase